MIRRGQVWWANLPQAVGSEPGGRRPFLVIQGDQYNRSKLKTIVVMALTSNLALAEAPGNVLLTREQTGLPKESVLLATQILTIDKGFLTEPVTILSDRLMLAAENGLRMVLEL